jgi:hypothetical protein
MITHRVSTSGYGALEVTLEAVQEVIMDLQDACKMAPQIEIAVEHVFADGLYMRKILIPKGVAFTGRRHKQDDLQIMFYGDLTIISDDGHCVHLVGQNEFRSMKGTKPFAIAREDTLWATIHHTHLTDLDEIEKELFEDEDVMFDFKTGRVLQEVLL